MSLPVMQLTAAFSPGMIFRSSARLLYLTQFALAVAVGAGVQVRYATRTRIAGFVVPLMLALHVVDLGSHDRRFIQRGARLPPAELAQLTQILSDVGDGRAAVDRAPPLLVKQSVDDVGFFDSIMLARPYRMTLSLAGSPADLNIQVFNGSDLSLRALGALGVNTILTTAVRQDLTQVQEILGIKVYKIPTPARRAEFFPLERVRYLPTENIHGALRDAKFDLSSALLLPLESLPVAARNDPAAIAQSARVQYHRPDSDHIEIVVESNQPGFLRVIESWDPGWSATIDGAAAPIVPAFDALLAIAVEPGRHKVQLEYRTPGALAGGIISALSLALLGGWVWWSGRQPRP